MALAITLLLTGIAAILLEFFVPAFGLIGIIGGASVVASIIKAFKFSTAAGAVFLTASLIIVPALMLIFFRIFPKTFIGRKLILHRRMDSREGFESTAVDYTELAGKDGTAHTDLRPSGTIIVNNLKYSAVTGGEYIEKGKKVEILKTEGSRIIVTEAK
ncbi:MAG: NfeD family protein [Spirochaetales bacterium]|uniref:NfeD family protein n=1 Tax=Candidatus Thalassospirochaeta sargassi TaxID=3119039 RepID=A0AAJ1ICP7_9SPIO|nr:NfeD family protein [Spirochaetales bacterium]